MLGVDIANIESFNAIAQRQVIEAMAGQKGPQTDQDAARIEKTVAGIENSEEANKFILNSMEALSHRRIIQDEFWTNHLEKNKSYEGVKKKWNEYKRSTPMVSDSVKNPRTGRPMFFYQFQQAMRGRRDMQGNPFTDENILQAWRDMQQPLTERDL